MQNDSIQLSRGELEAFRRELLSACHSSMPGIVESFNPETQTACIRPAVRFRRGGSEPVQLPLLRDVPVFFPGNRASAITFPVSPGDECLVIFSDICIDGWFDTGSDPLPPSSRQHDLSDAFAFVGFRSHPNALPDVPSSPSFFGGSFVTEEELAEALFGKADADHTHDDRYYTESETDTLLSGKSDTGHTHDGRYYTETETNTKLSGKKDTQTAVASPSASGTAVAFIDTIKQDEQGVITPTRKTVRTATASQSGLMSAADKTALDAVPTIYAKAGSATGNTRTMNLNGTTFYPRCGQYASVAASASHETAVLPNGALIFIATTTAGTAAIYLKTSGSVVRRLTAAISNVTVSCASSKVTITNGTSSTIYTVAIV